MDGEKMARALGRIEGKIDGIQGDVGYIQNTVDGLDDRMRHVEKRVAINSGVIATAVSAGVAGLITVLTPGV